MTSDLQQFLSDMADLVERSSSRPATGYAYLSYERFVLDRGRGFSGGTALPGEPQQCYRNATHAATRPGWTYWEGYAWPEDLIPVNHAWCTDGDGQLVEVTWQEAAPAYWGVSFTLPELFQTMEVTGYYGIIGNDYLNDHKLLKTGELI